MGIPQSTLEHAHTVPGPGHQWEKRAPMWEFPGVTQSAQEPGKCAHAQCLITTTSWVVGTYVGILGSSP